MRDLRALYVLVQNDRVIVFETNLSKFIGRLRDIVQISEHIKSYPTYNRYFKKNDQIIILGSDKKIYSLQKIL